jgi:SIR2-like protein
VDCRTLQREDLLAAGAVVEVMARESLDTLLPEQLFGPDGAASYEPGPIAHQVAYLRTFMGERMTMLTTNYDDLIERALMARGIAKKHIKSYVRRRSALPAGAVPVTHLHGFAGRDADPKAIVLTEEQYHRMQRGSSWQEQYVTERL